MRNETRTPTTTLLNKIARVAGTLALVGALTGCGGSSKQEKPQMTLPQRVEFVLSCGLASFDSSLNHGEDPTTASLKAYFVARLCAMVASGQ